MGLGKGKGGDQTTNVIAGSCCAICCGICFVVIGLPMLIAGIVMVQIYKGQYDDAFTTEIETNPDFDDDVDTSEVKDILYKVGIAIIVISVLCLVAGVIMVILLCTGCCGNRTSNRAPIVHNPTQTTVITYGAQQPQGQYPAQPQQQQYPAQPQQQYPAQPQQQYPAQPQQPYYPQNPQQPEYPAAEPKQDPYNPNVVSPPPYAEKVAY